MAKSDYIATNDDAFNAQLQTFKNGIGSYSVLLGLTAAQIAAQAAVAPGIETRFRALVQIIKTNANYNEAIGQALGIEGAQQTGPDLTTIQPIIDAVISGNHVNVKWGWGGNSAYLDICEIQVDRNDGKGFVLLAYDTTPGYTDTQPFPAAPVTWTYRAIYRVDDDRTGQWSLPVSVTYKCQSSLLTQR